MQLLQARQIAIDICYQLQPYCSKINIAGSIRRKKPEVKDIEIVCCPEIVQSFDLFGNILNTQRHASFVKLVCNFGKVIKGNALTGKYMQIELSGKVILDMFITDEADYYRQYAIRTGSSEYSHLVIAGAWKRLGWCGSDAGLRRISDCIEIKQPDGKSKWKCINKKGQIPPVWKTEEDFFFWLNVKYLPAEKRYI